MPIPTQRDVDVGLARIDFSAALQHRLDQLPRAAPEVRAVAEQALGVAQRLLDDARFRVEWDVDNPDELVTGSSLGLGLVLAILSARRHQAVVPGLAVTGTVSAAGDVGSVAQLEAKARAALWHGVRVLLYPAANQEQGGLTPETKRELVEAGIRLQAVRTVATARQAAFPGVASPPGARLQRGIGVAIIACLVTGTLCATALMRLSHHWRSAKTASGVSQRPASPSTTHSEPYPLPSGPKLQAKNPHPPPMQAHGLDGSALLLHPGRRSSRPEETTRPGVTPPLPQANHHPPLLRLRYFVVDGDKALDSLARGHAQQVFRFQTEPLGLDKPVWQLMLRLYDERETGQEIVSRREEFFVFQVTR